LLSTEEQKKNFNIVDGYHFGGYAKMSAGLVGFMNDFYTTTLIPTDFVYTGKLFFGVLDLAKKNFFTPGSQVLVIHSGGLQGNASLPKNLLRF
jgi:1-aminocyclopropane-1-carboxylate deaminase